MANLSLCSTGQRLQYWNKPGSEDSSRGRWRYLYLCTALTRAYSRTCVTANVPSCELVEHVDIFLQVVHLGRIARLEDREWRRWCTILQIGATRLEEPTGEEDLVEGICVLKELERRACLDKLVVVTVKVTLWYSLKMLVELVAEDWRRRMSWQGDDLEICVTYPRVRVLLGLVLRVSLLLSLRP